MFNRLTFIVYLQLIEVRVDFIDFDQIFDQVDAVLKFDILDNKFLFMRDQGSKSGQVSRFFGVARNQLSDQELGGGFRIH